MQVSKLKRPSREHHKQRIHRLKNHPFVVPVITFLGLFVVTMAAFIFLGGSTIGPSDSHIVNLYVDGKRQSLPSRAQTVGELLERNGVKIGEHDVVEPSKDAQITDDNFSVNVYRSQPVTIVDTSPASPKTLNTYSAQQTPTAIAEQAGFTVNPEDKVELSRNEDLTQQGSIGPKVVIKRAIPIKLNLFGVNTDIKTQAKTVEEVLKERKINYDSDSVSPALSTPIKANDAIFVTQPGKKIATTEEAIPFDTTTINDPNLTFGQSRTQQEGVPGKKVTVYEVAADGTRKPLQEVLVVSPVTKVIAKGTKIVEVAIGGDKGAVLTQAGIPTSQQYAADFVISRESGWRLTARNGSGCLGLGQACPGAKLTSACPDWQTNAICQIRFFDAYARNTYGSWQNAQQAWLVKHWW